MNKNEFDQMIEKADRRMHYSELEKEKLKYLLEYCHASDIKYTQRRMYEVFYKCDAMPGMEITMCDCDDNCARCGCSNYTAADDAELLLNREKDIFEIEPSTGYYFDAEIKSMLNKYKGIGSCKLTDTEIENFLKRIKKELKMICTEREKNGGI